LFSNVRVHSFAVVEDTVALPEVDIGRNARIRKAVLDTGCVIPEGMVVGEDAEADAKRFYRSDRGITLVTQDMLNKLG
jgi:glucose-1-phosphate adenylyltransferase